MTKLSQRELRNRMIRRLRKMRRDLKQTIIDMNWWNNNRLDAQPFDLGFEIATLQCVEKQLEAWAVNDLDEMNRWSAKMTEIARHAETH